MRFFPNFLVLRAERNSVARILSGFSRRQYPAWGRPWILYPFFLREMICLWRACRVIPSFRARDSPETRFETLKNEVRSLSINFHAEIQSRRRVGESAHGNSFYAQAGDFMDVLEG